MFVDTHCHLDFEQFDEDRAEVWARAQSADVMRLIIPAVDLANSERVIRIAEQFDGVFCAVGIHPNSSAEFQPTDIDQLRELAQHPKVVAIGEIGLDYYWKTAPNATQHAAFQAQMALAAELDLPIIIHNRDAGEDCLALMADSPLIFRPNRGVMHSFSAELTIAQRALDLGFYLGFTGPLTYKKSDSLRQVASQLPLDRLLIETDAPYLSPQPYRGKRNEPAYVIEVADRLATIFGLSTSEIGRITTANAHQLFQLP